MRRRPVAFSAAGLLAIALSFTPQVGVRSVAGQGVGASDTRKKVAEVLVCHGAPVAMDGVVTRIPLQAVSGHLTHGDCRISGEAPLGVWCDRSEPDEDGFCASASATWQTPLSSAADAVAGLNLLPPGCVPATIYIDAAAPKGGDGSEKTPFLTLREALAGAEKRQACAIDAKVAPGRYIEGPLAVKLPAIVTGRPGVNVQGSFQVFSPTLVLSTLTLVGDLQSQLPAVLAPKPATLVFLDVRFLAPGGHAIRQHGGTLRVFRVDIAGAWTFPTSPSSGSAVHLTGGVDARLAFMRLSGNTRGLYASDAGTRVRGDFIRVEDTTIHPTRIANITVAGSCDALGYQYLGAVEVDSGAELTGSFWEIRRSQLAGLYAHDDGSARLHNVQIDATEEIRSGYVSCGGFGAIVHRAGTIDLSGDRRHGGLAITNSAVCGVVVGQAPSSGMDLHYGFIDFAPIGACIQQDGYDAERLHDHVDYRSDLGVPMRATSYSLPDDIL
jgi:hypothetical protein